MIADTLADAVADALRSLGVEPPTEVGIERPARREHGDWSTNAALASAKRAGRNPRELAQQVADALTTAALPHVEDVEIAGPGFVNFRLAPTWLHDVLTDVVAEGEKDYGRTDLGGGRRVNVEFVSANPNKPPHAGHARGACVGDSVARLLERTGHDVSREYYLNDRGTQMQLYAASLAARKRGEQPPDDGYLGAYVSEWAAEMPDDADPLEWGYARALRDHQATMERLGISFDTWFSERSMVDSGAIATTLEDLRDRGVVFDDDGAVWLRSTDHGDDKDRVLVKSDGEYTYLLPDIAYHRDKFARGFELLLNVWGADHHGYVARLKAAIAALGHDPDELEIQVTQLVDLERDGEPVPMSGRTGEMVTIDELLDAVGSDAVRFTYLVQSTDTRQTIDLDAITARTMDNPVFYVQMAHARARSIERNARGKGFERPPLDQVDLGVLTHERELDVLRSLSAFPELLAVAARERAPHKITTWVRELAAAFHGFFHDCYVVGDDIPVELTNARLWLVEVSRIGLAIGLDLLGVSAPEEM
ncbi:MAG: arginine--tRNA ligase [Actinomycetota bacterium]